MSDDAQFIVDGWYVRTNELRVLQRNNDTWDIEQRWAATNANRQDIWMKIPLVEERTNPKEPIK